MARKMKLIAVISVLLTVVIVVLSFVPILASRPFGAAVVFVVTSILSAMFDGMFVIMQRYNRLRITKMIDNGANRRQE